jgi:hypothetical protein
LRFPGGGTGPRRKTLQAELGTPPAPRRREVRAESGDPGGGWQVRVPAGATWVALRDGEGDPGLTQRELAEPGVSYAYISRIEDG